MSVIEFYRCDECKNIVVMIKNGSGTLDCCGQHMTRLEANTTDAAQEKHVPVVTKEAGRLEVVVGSTLHPMLPEHYIEWIALVSDDKVEIKFLKPGEEPKAEFEQVDYGTAFEYCNLHGLWKANF